MARAGPDKDEEGTDQPRPGDHEPVYRSRQAKA